MPPLDRETDVTDALGEQPNVLFVMADQLDPGLMGTYGHDVVETPHLDRLARDGVRFDAAYTPAPVCGPARQCVMTGDHVSTIGAWDNAAPMAVDQPTIPHYLSRAGYDTVLAGKMHFVGADQLHGYDRRFQSNIYPAGFDWTPARGVDEQAVKGHAEAYVADAVDVDRWSEWLSFDEDTHHRACEYLRAVDAFAGSAQDPRPFFLTVSYHHPHEPFWPPQEYWDRYQDADLDVPGVASETAEAHSTMDEWVNYFHGVQECPELTDPDSIRTVWRAYYALVSYVDDKVGELLEELESRGLDEETVVVFCSDHGEMLCRRGMVQKRSFYEEASRVPLIVRFPDRARAGTTCDDPVSLIDLLPTFLDLAGVPEDDRLSVDGQSLFQPLTKDADGRTVFAEHHAQGVHSPCFMARKGDYKYIYVHGYDDQLFDLSRDPEERIDRADDPQFSDIRDRLRQRVLDRFDPAMIDERVERSIRRRNVVHAAMQETGTAWDYGPSFDPTRPVLEQYLPGRREP